MPVERREPARERAPIVVGIDFSDGSAAAAMWACTLAQRMGAPMVAVHVAEQDRWEWVPEQVGWMGRVGLDPHAVVVRSGTPWVELSRHGAEARAMMLVVGSHGAGGRQPLAPGRTTELLLARSRQPVLVVPHPRPPP